MLRPKTKQPYKTVRGLLADRKRWCKGQGKKVTPDGQESYCLLGAVEEVYGMWTEASTKAVEKLYSLLPGFDSIVYFNDRKYTKHSDILKVLKKAKI